MDGQTISAEEFRSRFRALRRGGVGPGLPKRRRDAQIFLRAAATALAPGVPYSEKAVGEALTAWLRRTGGRVEMDHVTLRRYLVDAGYLVRDAAGTSYDLHRSGRGIAVFEDAVDSIEAADLLEPLAPRPANRPASGGESP